MSTITTSDTTQHAVFARLVDGKRVRVTDPASWNAAQEAWDKRTRGRIGNLYPHVKHFEVRSMDDPDYQGAPVRLALLPVLPGQRGTIQETAARRAWKLQHGVLGPRDRPQGTGGWFYYRNGQTAAQGIGSLCNLCVKRNLIVEGANGRWYVLDQGEV